MLGGSTGGLSNDVVVAAPARDDPYKGFNFRVEIEGVSLAAFSEVAGLESETAVIEYRVGGETNTVRKLPGLTRYANIVLRRGITQDAELWSWRKSVIEGRVERRNGSIILLDDEGNEVERSRPARTTAMGISDRGSSGRGTQPLCSFALP